MASQPVNEYNCQLRRRLGFLPDPPQDHWWPLGDPDRASSLMFDLITGPAQAACWPFR
jgi:hypothetical protein